MSFYTIETMKTSNDQKHKVLKAKVALAMRDEFGTVPKEEEIEATYRMARVLYKAVLGTHFIKKQQVKNEQLVLF
jgi:hypothetical protein